jgi:Ca-activated chloride channel family protein
MQIYAKIDELEPVTHEAETYRPIQALYYWPMAASLGCLIVLLLIEIFRRQREPAH